MSKFLWWGALVVSAFISPWGFPWNLPICIVAASLHGIRMAERRSA